MSVCAQLALCASAVARAGDFVHFESAHVHPLALSPSGKRLYAINTPEGRLAIFRVTSRGELVFKDDVPVGLEPVSLAVRPGTDEVWVANHLSDSVSIVDGRAGRFVATLAVGDEPTDVVFASGRAFVSLAGKEDRVVVYDAASREHLATLDIFGDDPRAMAVSLDGSRVALVVLESGNGTTGVRPTTQRPPPAPDPPRDVLFPPLIGPLPAPQTPLIVKLDRSSGKWLDETGGDWSDLAFLGFGSTLPDHDLFWIDAESTPPKVVQTVPALGTLLFDVDVHPETGDVWIPNTDARNVVRFEPNLRGQLVETRVSIVDSRSGVAPRFVDLNPHIDPSVTPGPPGEIALSLALPGDGIFSRDGRTYYLTAFGSEKVGVLDGRTGVVLDRIAVGGGPSGLALQRGGRHLYVMQRFSNTIATVDLRTRTAVATIGVAGPRAFDPSPPEVRDGRSLLYDAQLSSGHGDLACASCHVFGNFDGLAWDLGDPQGEFVSFDTTPWLKLQGTRHKGFDPMKGPMITQTLRGLRGQEPFHWRGDRRNFQHFNGAFVSLMGRDAPLSDEEMDAFTRFIMTIEYPPNPYRLLDDRLPPTIPGHGDPSIGERIFLTEPVQTSPVFRCVNCHPLPFGTTHGIQGIGDESIEVAHFRNLYEKLGMDRFEAGSEPGHHRKSGFGTQHHGIFPLEFFLRVSAPGLGTRVLDMSAFLVSFSTGTFPCVGRQVTLPAEDPTSALSIVGILTAQADLNRCGVIAKGQIDDAPVGWFYNRFARQLIPDSRRTEPRTPAELVASLGEGDVVTFSGVPFGTAIRLGVDRDRDGCLDGDERSQQSDPANPGTPEPDADGDGLPDAVDRCAGWLQRDHDQHDTNQDGLPDECQCGDVDDNGSIDARDVTALWFHLAGVPLHASLALEKCNVVGVAGNDPSLCTWDDLVALYQSLDRRGRRAGGLDLEPRCLPDDPPPSPVTTTCVDEPLSAAHAAASDLPTPR